MAQGCTPNHTHPAHLWRLRWVMAALLSAVLFTPTLFAAEQYPASNDTASTLIDLRHEPIQPLFADDSLDPQKVRLGEQLFHDVRLSRANDMACISCHDLNTNGADGRAYSPNRSGDKLSVNTLTIFNSSRNHYYFWDGRANNLAEQIDFVVASDTEFATSWLEILRKLRQDTQYTQTFEQLYPDGLTEDSVRDALITFERSLITVNSRFDRFLLGDDAAITPKELTGYLLFKAYGCATCHQGQNVGGNLFIKFGIFSDHFSHSQHPTRADLGRFNVTGEERDRHVFRVPSLRLAALTPPYFHDGSADTLEQAVKEMARHQLGRKIPDTDIAHIVAFLKTLPGEYQGQILGVPQQTDPSSEAP